MVPYLTLTLLNHRWSSLLTPELVVLRFTGTGRELDFLNPAIPNYTPGLRNLPPLYPTAHNYTLIPDNITLSEPNNYV